MAATELHVSCFQRTQPDDTTSVQPSTSILPRHAFRPNCYSPTVRRLPGVGRVSPADIVCSGPAIADAVNLQLLGTDILFEHTFQL